MNFIRLLITQPVTVAVGVVLIVLAGLLALQHIPIQLTPNVEDTIIAVTTSWEGASPEEVEREVVEEQEEKLQGIANLRTMTSSSTQGQGQIRLEFNVGTQKEAALREVSDKLREVPDYPDNVDEPVVEASDPDNRDYIAWIVFGSTDHELDIRTLQDFAEDRIKPIFERVPGVSEVNVLGGRERETQIRYDPVRLAQFRVTPSELLQAIQSTNRNISAGEVDDAKSAVRVRTISQYEAVEAVERTVLKQTPAGPVYIGDVAEVVETYKKPTSFVRSRGEPVIAINVQKEVGENVMQVMGGVQNAIADITAEGGLLETQARQMKLNGVFSLEQVYDQTVYIDDALALVRSNIWLGGALAVGVLLLFLRSLRSVGIIALAIPISVIGAVVLMVALGRSVNVISLAGMAFAVGMVVDNAIVVLENIFRHLEMGKVPMRAAYDGVREVWGAVLASTLTTVVVFIPILLVQEEAGQLFRDIALAICASVTLSLVVSISVIPSAAARILKPIVRKHEHDAEARARRMRAEALWKRIALAPVRGVKALGRGLHALPNFIANFIYWLCGSWLARIAVVAGLTIASLLGTWALLPPMDYLPTGNRNLIFGILIPPPGYNIDHQVTLAERVESTIRPFWEAAGAPEGTEERAEVEANLPQIPTFDWAKGAPGDPVVPPPVSNYFFVAFGPMMFHGGIASEPEHVKDLEPLFQHATRPDQAPGVLAFARQVPLFRLGGASGSAVKIDLSGPDLAEVTNAASAMFMRLMNEYGPQTVQPNPSNFNIYGPEIQVHPDQRRLADLGLTPTDLGLAIQTNGDGAIIGDYRIAGDTIDLKLITKAAVDRQYIENFEDVPLASPIGQVVPAGSVAEFIRTTSPPQINHVDRQRSVTLEFTPPSGMPLQAAVDSISQIIEDARATGEIAPGVETNFAGSASKLESVRNALLGNGTLTGALTSSLVLALLIVYLLMCVLFQSFLRPLVIMFSVPLATVGGFAALYAVYVWSESNRYMPRQTLDVLTMLGFIILIGVVVNNAILLVHQSLNFMRGEAESESGLAEPMPPRRAIAESVRSRVRPIFMSTLTSIGGMAPLVLMPGSGSELYRGLGAVVLGGLLVSTVFTVFLVPLLFSLVTDLQMKFGRLPERERVAQAHGARNVPDEGEFVGAGLAGAGALREP